MIMVERGQFMERKISEELLKWKIDDNKKHNFELSEEQKGKICDLIEKSLNSARLKTHKTDDDDNLPLVDLFK